MDDLSRFCCQNSDCPDFGKRGAENLTVCDRYGPNTKRRMLSCRTCKSRFSEQTGTPFFGSTLPEQKLVCVMEHIALWLRRWQDGPPRGGPSRYGDPLLSDCR